MLRRLHRRHDREVTRSLFLTAVLLSVGGLGILIGSWGGSNWLIGLGALVFVGGLGYGLLHGRRINSTICPKCGRRLSRHVNTTEFFCEKCQIVWWTTTYGSSAWSWGRTTESGGR